MDREGHYLRIRVRSDVASTEPDSWWESAEGLSHQLSARAAVQDFVLVSDSRNDVRAVVALYGEEHGRLLGESVDLFVKKDPRPTRSPNPLRYGILQSGPSLLYRTAAERASLLATWRSWRQRFSRPFLFGQEPLPFIADRFEGVTPLRVLVLGAGQGRNALWLADQGHLVTAVELVDVAADQMRSTAQARGLVMDIVCADALRWLQLPSTQRRHWDIVVLSYFFAGSIDTQAAVLKALAGSVPHIVAQASSIVTTAEEFRSIWNDPSLHISEDSEQRVFVSSL